MGGQNGQAGWEERRGHAIVPDHRQLAINQPIGEPEHRSGHHAAQDKLQNHARHRTGRSGAFACRPPPGGDGQGHGETGGRQGGDCREYHDWSMGQIGRRRQERASGNDKGSGGKVLDAATTAGEPRGQHQKHDHERKGGGQQHPPAETCTCGVEDRGRERDIEDRGQSIADDRHASHAQRHRHLIGGARHEHGAEGGRQSILTEAGVNPGGRRQNLLCRHHADHARAIAHRMPGDQTQAECALRHREGGGVGRDRRHHQILGGPVAPCEYAEVPSADRHVHSQRGIECGGQRGKQGGYAIPVGGRGFDEGALLGYLGGRPAQPGDGFT